MHCQKCQGCLASWIRNRTRSLSWLVRVDVVWQRLLLFLLPAKGWALSEGYKSCIDVGLKVVFGVTKTKNKWGNLTLKLYTHYLDVHRNVGPGWRLRRLRPSRLWRDSREGAEETAVGRRFRSATVRGRKGWKRTWCCVCSWCSRCAPLVLGSQWWKKLAGFMSTWSLTF